MRKLIYVVGGIFLSIGIVFFALAIKTALTYQPMQISASEFKKLFQDKRPIRRFICIIKARFCVLITGFQQKPEKS